jgi:hypothetical protein
MEIGDNRATLEIHTEEPAFTATYTPECDDGAI